MNIELKQAAQQALDVMTRSQPCVINVGLKNDQKAAIEALRTAIQQAESEPVGAREALERIASWSEHPAMLGVDYGSNGVRDYYRKIARDALTHPAPGVPDAAIDSAIYNQCPDFDDWHEGPSIDDIRAIVRAAMLTSAQAQKGQP